VLDALAVPTLEEVGAVIEDEAFARALGSQWRSAAEGAFGLWRG